MADVIRHPCDEGVIRAKAADAPGKASAKPWILAATIIGSGIVFINGSTVNVALPALQRDLGATVVDIQWIINSYTLFLASLILLGGSLGDHLGRKHIFMLGVVIFAVASIGCGLAPNAGLLIIARAVQGIGGALLTPGSLALISASFEEGERGRAIGLWAGFSALTAAIGPLLGGWLIDTLSWRWIFFMLIPLAIVVLAITLRYVPESRDEEEKGKLDWWGALLATLGLGSLTYGLIESSNRGLGDPLVLLTLAVGTLLLIVFLVVEARKTSPMVPLKLFRSATFSGTNALTLLLYAALSGALFFLPLNLIQVQGYSATAAGASLLPFILLMSLLSRWAGGLVERVGARRPLIIGPLIVGAGFLLFMPPGIGGSYWTTFFPGMVVLGLGMAISVAPLTTAVMTAVPNHYAGTASGINNAVSRVASLFAVAILGVVMVNAFGNSLGEQLAALDLPPDAQQAVLDARADLANIAIPDILNAEQGEQVEQAISSAFVAGFRLMAVISAVLAFASAGITWLMIKDQETEERVALHSS